MSTASNSSYPQIDLDALEFYMHESRAQGFTHAGNPEMWLALIAELREERKEHRAAEAELHVLLDDLRAARKVVEDIRTLVDEQAEDEGLWFEAATAPEAYLQQELRRLHEAVERAIPTGIGG